MTLLATLAFAIGTGAGPPTREVSRFDSARVGYTVVQTPGVGSAGQTLELAVRLEELRKVADPSFGKRRLLAAADLVIYLVGPKGDAVDARVAADDGDEGNFVVHFTPRSDGIYSVHLVGKAPDGITIQHAVLVSVGVWPMLADLRPDALPKKLPPPSLGDIAHGKLVCARDCNQAALAMPSEVAESFTDKELLTTVAPLAAHLRDVDRLDLLAYVRSLYIRVRDFFPSAAAYVPEKRGLDSEAVARIKTLAGVAPATAEGLVFVVYGGEPLARIEPADRTTKHSLTVSSRLGYVVYGNDTTSELAIALGREPTFAIKGARRRNSDGSAHNAHVKADNPLSRRALELAHAYVDEERERATVGDLVR